MIREEDEPIFTPRDFVRYVAEVKKLPINTIKVPERLVITYQRSAYEYAKSLINGKLLEWWIYGENQPFSVGKFNDVEVGLGRFWIGAPAAATTLEEMIACGAKEIFEVGLSGGLQPFLKPGDIIIVTEAIRDEGTSHHYFPPEVKVESSEDLRNRLLKQLNADDVKHHCGIVWSTDGVYRETRGKFLKFKRAGVLAVNMETSAIFAVSKYRGVKAASVQVISDVLYETGWIPAFEHETVKEGVKIAINTVLKTLSKS
ncbi:MAG: nucleoside phosphorylase [Candidatus Bathyarchaeia archaeon]